MCVSSYLDMNHERIGTNDMLPETDLLSSYRFLSSQLFMEEEGQA